MAQLKLKGGEVALIDDADVALVAGFEWRVAETAPGYRYVGACKKHSKPHLHRFLTGAPAGLVVDHINGNTLDNRRSNLRVCTFGENLQNRRKPRHSTAPYKGIEKDRLGNWRARIGPSSNRSRVSGSFKSPEEAAAAYDIFAVLRYGQFACLNFPHVFPEISQRKA